MSQIVFMTSNGLVKGLPGVESAEICQGVLILLGFSFFFFFFSEEKIVTHGMIDPSRSRTNP